MSIITSDHPQPIMLEAPTDVYSNACRLALLFIQRRLEI